MKATHRRAPRDCISRVDSDYSEPFVLPKACMGRSNTSMQATRATVDRLLEHSARARPHDTERFYASSSVAGFATCLLIVAIFVALSRMWRYSMNSYADSLRRDGERSALHVLRATGRFHGRGIRSFHGMPSSSYPSDISERQRLVV